MWLGDSVFLNSYTYSTYYELPWHLEPLLHNYLGVAEVSFFHVHGEFFFILYRWVFYFFNNVTVFLPFLFFNILIFNLVLWFLIFCFRLFVFEGRPVLSKNNFFVKVFLLPFSKFYGNLLSLFFQSVIKFILFWRDIWKFFTGRNLLNVVKKFFNYLKSFPHIKVTIFQYFFYVKMLWRNYYYLLFRVYFRVFINIDSLLVWDIEDEKSLVEEQGLFDEIYLNRGLFLGYGEYRKHWAYMIKFWKMLRKYYFFFLKNYFFFVFFRFFYLNILYVWLLSFYIVFYLALWFGLPLGIFRLVHYYFIHSLFHIKINLAKDSLKKLWKGFRWGRRWYSVFIFMDAQFTHFKALNLWGRPLYSYYLDYENYESFSRPYSKFSSRVFSFIYPSNLYNLSNNQVLDKLKNPLVTFIKTFFLLIEQGLKLKLRRFISFLLNIAIRSQLLESPFLNSSAWLSYYGVVMRRIVYFSWRNILFFYLGLMFLGIYYLCYYYFIYFNSLLVLSGLFYVIFIGVRSLDKFFSNYVPKQGLTYFLWSLGFCVEWLLWVFFCLLKFFIIFMIIYTFIYFFWYLGLDIRLAFILGLEGWIISPELLFTEIFLYMENCYFSFLDFCFFSSFLENRDVVWLDNFSNYLFFDIKEIQRILEVKLNALSHSFVDVNFWWNPTVLLDGRYFLEYLFSLNINEVYYDYKLKYFYNNYFVMCFLDMPFFWGVFNMIFLLLRYVILFLTYLPTYCILIGKYLFLFYIPQYMVSLESFFSIYYLLNVFVALEIFFYIDGLFFLFIYELTDDLLFCYSFFKDVYYFIKFFLAKICFIFFSFIGWLLHMMWFVFSLGVSLQWDFITFFQAPGGLNTFYFFSRSNASNYWLNVIYQNYISLELFLSHSWDLYLSKYRISRFFLDKDNLASESFGAVDLDLSPHWPTIINSTRRELAYNAFVDTNYLTAEEVEKKKNELIYFNLQNKIDTLIVPRFLTHEALHSSRHFLPSGGFQHYVNISSRMRWFDVYTRLCDWSVFDSSHTRAKVFTEPLDRHINPFVKYYVMHQLNIYDPEGYEKFRVGGNFFGHANNFYKWLSLLEVKYTPCVTNVTMRDSLMDTLKKNYPNVLKKTVFNDFYFDWIREHNIGCRTVEPRTSVYPSGRAYNDVLGLSTERLYPQLSLVASYSPFDDFFVKGFFAEKLLSLKWQYYNTADTLDLYGDIRKYHWNPVYLFFKKVNFFWFRKIIREFHFSRHIATNSKSHLTWTLLVLNMPVKKGLSSVDTYGYLAWYFWSKHYLWYNVHPSLATFTISLLDFCEWDNYRYYWTYYVFLDRKSSYYLWQHPLAKFWVNFIIEDTFFKKLFYYRFLDALDDIFYFKDHLVRNFWKEERRWSLPHKSILPFLPLWDISRKFNFPLQDPLGKDLWGQLSSLFYFYDYHRNDWGAPFFFGGGYVGPWFWFVKQVTNLPALVESMASVRDSSARLFSMHYTLDNTLPHSTLSQYTALRAKLWESTPPGVEERVVWEAKYLARHFYKGKFSQTRLIYLNSLKCNSHHIGTVPFMLQAESFNLNTLYPSLFYVTSLEKDLWFYLANIYSLNFENRINLICFIMVLYFLVMGLLWSFVECDPLEEDHDNAYLWDTFRYKQKRNLKYQEWIFEEFDNTKYHDANLFSKFFFQEGLYFCYDPYMKIWLDFDEDFNNASQFLLLKPWLLPYFKITLALHRFGLHFVAWHKDRRRWKAGYFSQTFHERNDNLAAVYYYYGIKKLYWKNLRKKEKDLFEFFDDQGLKKKEHKGVCLPDKHLQHHILNIFKFNIASFIEDDKYADFGKALNLEPQRLRSFLESYESESSELARIYANIVLNEIYDEDERLADNYNKSDVVQLNAFNKKFNDFFFFLADMLYIPVDYKRGPRWLFCKDGGNSKVYSEDLDAHRLEFYGEDNPSSHDLDLYYIWFFFFPFLLLFFALNDWGFVFSNGALNIQEQALVLFLCGFLGKYLIFPESLGLLSWLKWDGYLAFLSDLPSGQSLNNSQGYYITHWGRVDMDERLNYIYPLEQELTVNGFNRRTSEGWLTWLLKVIFFGGYYLVISVLLHLDIFEALGDADIAFFCVCKFLIFLIILRWFSVGRVIFFMETEFSMESPSLFVLNWKILEDINVFFRLKKVVLKSKLFHGKFFKRK